MARQLNSGPFFQKKNFLHSVAESPFWAVAVCVTLALPPTIWAVAAYLIVREKERSKVDLLHLEVERAWAVTEQRRLEVEAEQIKQVAASEVPGQDELQLLKGKRR
jgi:hypothetical protein